MKTIEVMEENGPIKWKGLRVYHGDCSHGRIGLSEVKAIIDKGKRRQGKDKTDLIQFTCEACGRQFWVLRQSETMSLIVNTAVDGEDRTMEVYDGNLVTQDYYPSKRLLNAEKIRLKVRQVKLEDIPGGDENATTNQPS